MLHAVAFLATAFSSGVQRKVPYAGKFSKNRVTIPYYRAPEHREFRGVWVATVENIDFPKVNSAERFKAEYTRILNNAQKAGFNAIIFQIPRQILKPPANNRVDKPKFAGGFFAYCTNNKERENEWN